MVVHVLVTGATGYIGGRLVPRLLEAGHKVRVLVRDATRVQGRPWAADVEVVEGDAVAGTGLDRACKGVDAAYYLIHAMGAGKGFEERDRAAASNFVAAADAADVSHIIYLGGLLPAAPSEHLASRAEVGRILREAGHTTEFRAGPIIGSGSASFEMTRYLTERLPVMVTPKWVDNLVQPIGVTDVLAYLQAALDVAPQGVVEIGADALSFREMMKQYAEVRGLKRRIFATPVLAPTLAGRWVQFITPIPNRIAIPLIRGIVTPVTADTEAARRLFPAITPIDYRSAVARAIERETLSDVETRWSGAQPDEGYVIEDWENLKQEIRTVETTKSAEDVWALVEGLGGRRGWLTWRWAWRLRGGIDRAIGGPGLRRGRRHPERLLVGEAVDWWRVEAIEPGRLLRLRAEMKVPGKAWLQFEVNALPDGGSRLVQTALFEPKGLAGLLYWDVLYPAHRVIFRDLARAIVRQA